MGAGETPRQGNQLEGCWNSLSRHNDHLNCGGENRMRGEIQEVDKREWT